VFDSHWFPCTPTSWDAEIEKVKATAEGNKFRTHNFRNPFQNARARGHPPGPDGKEFGYLRGWHILDYDTQVKTNPGWGVGPDAPRVAVCYKNGVLGAAVSWHTGEFCESNRLTAYRSMYPSKM
jgi:hypothetical protein